VGAGDVLRELDRRLLPRLADGLDRLARSAAVRRLRRPRPLIVAALASASALAAAAVWTAAHRPEEGTATATVVRVGVVDGQSIPGYVASSRSELDRLVAYGRAAGRPYALVTFTAYLSPDRLAPTLAGVDVVQVHARVPLPDQQTGIVRIPVAKVPADVVAGMAALAEQKDQEAANYGSLSAKLTGDGAQERRLRTVYARGARLAAAEAKAYRSGCSCVYAAVVRGAPDALNQVAHRPQVRAVDPAPEVRRLDQAVFLPPLPEQTGVVRPPADRSPKLSPHAEPRRDRVFRPARRSSLPATSRPPAAATSPTVAGTPSATDEPTASSVAPPPSPTPSTNRSEQ
jgi:hypothetical protein